MFLALTLIAEAIAASSDGRGSDLRIIWSWWSVHQPRYSSAPFPGMAECVSELRIPYELRYANDRCVNLAAQHGVSVPQPGSSGKEPRFNYLIKVENTSTRKVTRVDWEYDFMDPVSGKLLYRHQFTNETSLKPGRRTVLTVLSSRPPTPTMPASSAGLKESDAYREDVRVTRIKYSDEG